LTNGSFELGTPVNDANNTQTFNAGPTSITGVGRWGALSLSLPRLGISITVVLPRFLTARWGGPPVSILASAGGTNQTFTDSAVTTSLTWVPFSMVFTATSASTAITLTGAAGVEYIGLDNVDVELAGSGVPEPGTYGLTALGLSGLMFIARRRARLR
jgi:hypothetical protein